MDKDILQKTRILKPGWLVLLVGAVVYCNKYKTAVLIDTQLFVAFIPFLAKKFTVQFSPNNSKSRDINQKNFLIKIYFKRARRYKTKN